MLHFTLHELWLFIKKYWQIFAILIVIVFFLFTSRNKDLGRLVKRMKQQRDLYDREIDRIREARAREVERNKQIEKERSEQLASLEREFEEKKTKLSENEKKNVKKLVKEFKKNPDKIAQKLRDLYGFNVLSK